MAERTLKEEGALTKMRGLIFGFSITRAIAVAAELGIADRLADAPRTAAELARECGVLEHPLYRMLRALAGEGVFAEDKDGRFALTPMAELLRSDHPRSLRDWTIYVADLPYRSSMEMLHSLKTGESAFRRTFGASVFASRRHSPKGSAKHHSAKPDEGSGMRACLPSQADFSGARTGRRLPRDALRLLSRPRKPSWVFSVDPKSPRSRLRAKMRPRSSQCRRRPRSRQWLKHKRLPALLSIPVRKTIGQSP